MHELNIGHSSPRQKNARQLPTTVSVDLKARHRNEETLESEPYTGNGQGSYMSCAKEEMIAGRRPKAGGGGSALYRSVENGSTNFKRLTKTEIQEMEKRVRIGKKMVKGPKISRFTQE